MRRIAAMVTGLALAGGIAGAPAAADEDEGAGGVGVIEEVALGTIVVAGQAYSVGAFTRLEDEYGAELVATQLPSLAGGASPDEAAAAFEAEPAGAGGPRVLRHLRLTGSVPK